MIGEETMSRNKPNPKKKQNINAILFPILMVLLAAGSIFLIAYLTRNSRPKVTVQSTDVVVTPYLIATKQYSSAPPMMIDVKKKYTATFTMAKGGTFVIDLYADKAPITVNSFVFLARQRYFDGVTFHRVLDGFMAQGGDPTGTGGGNPGYKFRYEANNLKFDKAGVVAMANEAPASATNGSQFFITFGPQPSLDGGYTIFGQVIAGMDVVNGLTRRDPQQNPTFQGDIISTVTITEQ
jgi:cyclophilin family peptidyl-prolyl cis-trans isomerase